MPLLFILVGLFLICNIFGMISYSSYVAGKVLSFACVLILLSYFSGDVFVSEVSFNVFALIAYLIFFVFMIWRKYFSFIDTLIVGIVSFVYYLLLADDLSYMIGYSNEIIVMLFLLVVNLCCFNFYRGICLSLTMSISVILISAYFGFDNFGVVDVDFLFGFEMLSIFVLGYYVRDNVVKILIRRWENNKYDKESFFCYCTRNFEFIHI